MISVILENRIIHVGAWDFCLDPDGVATNPLPDGALEGDFDVRKTANGSFVLAYDYKALRAAEYPTIGDQLDALFKGGVFPVEMAEQIAAIKAKYPKAAT